MNPIETLNKLDKNSVEDVANASKIAENQRIIEYIRRFVPKYEAQASGGQLVTDCEPMNPNAEVKEPPCVLRIGEKRVFSLGDISCVIGAAKSRKTLFAAAIAGYFLENKTGDLVTTDTGGNLLYIDTEQSDYHAARTLKNITRYCTPEQVANIQFFALRNYDKFSRLAIIVQKIMQTRPNLVIIDGISDLMTDTNSLEESMQIISLMMAISKEFNCHICNVLHTTNTAAGVRGRGHIGGELERKCETVILVEKSAENDTISKVKPHATRNQAFITLQIEHGEQGQPILRRGEPMTDDELFNEVMTELNASRSTPLTKSQILPAIKKVLVKHGTVISDRKINEILERWTFADKLKTSKGSRNMTIYNIAGDE